jgi:Flp pilus assembly protein TadB
MDLKAQKDADLISAQLANQSLSDRLTAMKEAELISLRDSLDEWCLKQQESKWGHRLWVLVVILGVFAFIQGVTDIFVSGVNLLDIVLIILGTVISFSWYVGEKRVRKNKVLLAALNGEIAIRDYKGNLSNKSSKKSSKKSKTA